MNSEAISRAVAAYDEARCTMYGRKNEPRMSDRNRETIAPMIAAAVQAYICALPGWKFVPTNPTKAMMDAVDAAYDAFEAKPVGAWCGAASVYAAMIDAAPALESRPVALADANSKDPAKDSELAEARAARLSKRPVAFRVRTHDKTFVFESELAAQETAEKFCVDYEGLYVRDGTPLEVSAPSTRDPFRPAVDVDADDDFYPSREEI